MQGLQPATTIKTNEARAHHFVPKCWLAGFTDTGEVDGKLYVTDLKRKKQWQCAPPKVGHRRDFYRIDNPAASDPLALEKTLSEIESAVAPVFKALTKDKRGPANDFELSMLVEYMAIQWLRVPTSRAMIGNTFFTHFSMEMLSSKEAWDAAMRKANLPADHPDADYTKAKAAFDNGEISFSPTRMASPKRRRPLYSNRMYRALRALSLGS